ncbi:MAG: chitosanase [Alphaproteobacteria bacterium]|nr:chitosanase [Alphaproteobacteria bacterium]
MAGEKRHGHDLLAGLLGRGLGAIFLLLLTAKGGLVVMAQASGGDLADSQKKEIAMRLVSSAENSSLDWRAQYGYIEDIGDDRGYTGGIIGFTSATGDMLAVVQEFTARSPNNKLAAFIPALKKVNGSASHAGLGDAFEMAWRQLATDANFRAAQDAIRDRQYFNPAINMAKQDGLGVLGQFIYYDAAVVHGLGDNGDDETLNGIRLAAMKRAKTPRQGGHEIVYLNAFLDCRNLVMKQETAHQDLSRIETAQRIFLKEKNLQLNLPLRWKIYGDSYEIIR